MKKILIIAALLAASTATHAEKASVLDSCTVIGQSATSIMKARQRGVNMAQLLGDIKGSSILTKLIEMAYDQPRYSTEENTQREIEDFTNDVINGCMKAGIQLDK